MSRLLLCLLLLLTLPADAGIFDLSRAQSALFGTSLNNSQDFLPVDQAFRLDLVEADKDNLRLRFVNADGYYLYKHRFAFTSDHPDVSIGTPKWPAAEPKTDEFFGDVEVFYGITDLLLPIDNPRDIPFTLQVSYQGCADLGLCYPPEIRNIQIGNTPATAAQQQVGTVDWGSLALFFLAGLGLTFTPCVLPMLPILSGVVLRGQFGGLRGLSLSLAYVVPMAACFALLGALMGVFGAGLNLQARLQSPWVLVPFAIFFMVFALAMFGAFEMRMPRFIAERLDHLASRVRGGSLLGAATLGVLSSLLVSPCVTAPLVGALLYISATGDALGGGLKLFFLGLGMGAPLVLFATGGGALLPKSGTWMLGVRKAFGVMLLAVSVWLLERVLPAPVTLALWGLLAVGTALWLGALEFIPKSGKQRLAQLLGVALLVYGVSAWLGALQGQSDPLRPLGRLDAQVLPSTGANAGWQTLDTPAALDAALLSAKDAGQPVLLDWYADWCISCKVIEREVLQAPAVREQLSGYRLVRLDMTRSDAEQRALLDRYQLFGPPALQLFAPSGEEWQDLRTVGETDAESFVKRLRQASSRI
ncbi:MULTISPECIES: protein-disulfide reductase DsbD [Pseudomonadaceae]|jgi:thiol:disulfide interchange protein DsbD|uniref:Thiol:disulfide interchange protein DsbD n=2 Tax=Pseudomonadaceae TaxID=135621 RepID=A0AA42IRD4_9GAMM|nr:MULTISPECIES: protein-disulfide reductase DsbD [Pseudomonas]MBA4682382.1 protein-disulfide reductase DsbD [Pseudomonas sp.]MBG0843478.1 protein-disulfide reductase DsbD [Pseudomonas toyotomiensis]MBG0848441.1 protein-disulfide reductase DsbD [Pseudomonas chengduensis]MBZ9668052.1 protein-disulfide reductase DsbD [Pseudomonas chaetocerotis]MDH0704501.1 protein-disulfide reductase DsbD [Pseudomonas toyotomiensis]